MQSTALFSSFEIVPKSHRPEISIHELHVRIWQKDHGHLPDFACRWILLRIDLPFLQALPVIQQRARSQVIFIEWLIFAILHKEG